MARNPASPEDVGRVKRGLEQADGTKRGRLRLGPYLEPERNARREPVFEGPRFESQIEVWGKIPRDPNETMAVWWEHFDLETAVYGRGMTFRKSACLPPCVDFVPAIEWLVKKLKKSKDKP